MSREKFPSTQLDQYMLRFPDGMRDGLKDQAAKSKRSLNAEIIHRLADYALMEQEVQRLRRQLLDAEHRISVMAKAGERLATAQKLAKHWEEQANDLRRENQQLGAELATTKAMDRDATDAVGERPNTLYVLLDADGHITSWPEIYAHLGALNAAGNFDPDTINAAVVDAKMESSSKRDQQWWDLLQYYRKLRRAKK